MLFLALALQTPQLGQPTSKALARCQRFTKACDMAAPDGQHMSSAEVVTDDNQHAGRAYFWQISICRCVIQTERVSHILQCIASPPSSPGQSEPWTTIKVVKHPTRCLKDFKALLPNSQQARSK